jgi:predicted phage terminase large subunit-like protein
MNPAHIKAYLAKASPEEKLEMLSLLDELEATKTKEKCSKNFLDYVKHVWPSFIESSHHRVIADALERVENGTLKRLIICMAPRHTKSELSSHMFSSWCLGKKPDRKIIQCSNTSELATNFGRKVRDTVDSGEYQCVFPSVRLKADSKAAGRWNTDDKGEYFAIGIKGRVTGRGADILIVDDPHDEQEAAMNDPTVYDKTYEYYTSGPRQRLQPNAAIVIVMTRWHKRDLVGRVIKSSIENEGSDEWEIIEFPAILDEHTEDERPLWPSFWSIEELRAVRATISVAKWQSQYQQNPTSEEGAIIKRDWWRVWEKEDPPPVEFIIQAWDTAFLKKETADFSACTDWGIWYDEDGRSNIILLDAMKGRWEFPELKTVAYDHWKKVQPDSFIVEAKASGIPLAQELRRRGIIVSEYTPSRGNDKIAKANSVSDIFSSGMVWYPERRWAEEVIEECAEFPFGDHDDYVDTVTMALMRYRSGGFIRLPSDYEEDDEPRPKVAVPYY